MTRLTSVYSSFGAHVLAARLEAEGFDVQLRGALDSPYAVDRRRSRPGRRVRPRRPGEEASLVLLVDEVDEADEILDDDRPPIRDRRIPRWCVLVAVVLLAVAADPAVRLAHHAF